MVRYKHSGKVRNHSSTDFKRQAKEEHEKNKLEIEMLKEYEKFGGSWVQLKCNSDGIENPVEQYGQSPIVTFSGNKFVVKNSAGEKIIEGLFTLRPTRCPKEVDWIDTFGQDAGKTFPAVYEFSEGRLSFCAADEGMERPKKIEPKTGYTIRIFEAKPF